jgi:uncharacterized protein YqeY
MVSKIDLENALKEAIRSGDAIRKRTLRMALSNARLLEVEKGAAIEDAELLTLLQKEVKTRQETITDAERAGRQDIVQDTQAEIEILRSYLPAPFSAQELEALAQSVIQETGASSPADMGKVMQVLNSRLAGRATGKEASETVRRLLKS